VEEYMLPFQLDVPPNPGQAEMRPVVCILEKRPDFLTHWYKNKVYILYLTI